MGILSVGPSKVYAGGSSVIELANASDIPDTSSYVTEDQVASDTQAGIITQSMYRRLMAISPTYTTIEDAETVSYSGTLGQYNTLATSTWSTSATLSAYTYLMLSFNITCSCGWSSSGTPQFTWRVYFGLGGSSSNCISLASYSLSGSSSSKSGTVSKTIYLKGTNSSAYYDTDPFGEYATSISNPFTWSFWMASSYSYTKTTQYAISGTRSMYAVLA